MAIIKIKISALPSASSLSGLYGLGYQSGSSVKIPSNLLKGDTGATGATGPAGATGTNGKNVELQNNGTYIQWRLVGDVTWNNLVTLSTISGADGKEVELRNNSGQIQWRLTGGSWANLIDVSALQGPKGEKGDTGATGPQGIQGDKGDKGDKGDTGATGPQGIQGDKGDKGDTGAQGIQGLKGDKGDKGDTGATGAQGPAGAPVATDTGVAVVWTEDKIYNTYGSPGSGNITESMTGAVVGSTIIIIHSAASAPSYPASWHRLKGSYDYKASGVNMIYAQYIGGSRVQYTITQEE